MKSLWIFAILLCLAGICCKKDNEAPLTPWYPSTNSDGDPVVAIYESRVPCADCERTKVALVIYGNGQTDLLTTYLLSRIFVGNGDDRFLSEGPISISKGIDTDTTATVYELDADAPGDFKLYWKIGNDLLMMLDEQRKPRIGDASHGYILNRTL